MLGMAAMMQAMMKAGMGKSKAPAASAAPVEAAGMGMKSTSPAMNPAAMKAAMAQMMPAMAQMMGGASAAPQGSEPLSEPSAGGGDALKSFLSQIPSNKIRSSAMKSMDALMSGAFQDPMSELRSMDKGTLIAMLQMALGKDQESGEEPPEGYEGAPLNVSSGPGMAGMKADMIKKMM